MENGGNPLHQSLGNPIRESMKGVPAMVGVKSTVSG
jgi:hypothetical protein